MFPIYRKFFVLFGVLILFVMFFVNYWRKYAIETFTASSEKYPRDTYDSGQQVNIDGKYDIGDPVNRYKANGGPLQTNGSIDCDTKCQQQEECNRRNGNTCTTRSTPDRKCYCTFRQTKKEPFQNIAQTTENIERILTNMPNSTKTSWVYSKTKDSMVQVQKETIPLTDLKIDNLNKMTFSFRMKTDPAVNEKVPVLSFGSSTGGTFDFITKNFNTLEINTPTKVVSIGLDSTDKRITITLENGVFKVYENGIPNRNDISIAAGSLPSTSTLNTYNINMILNKTDANGVYIKDLKTFNQSLSEDDVRLSD